MSATPPPWLAEEAAKATLLSASFAHPSLREEQLRLTEAAIASAYLKGFRRCADLVLKHLRSLLAVLTEQRRYPQRAVIAEVLEHLEPLTLEEV